MSLFLKGNVFQPSLLTRYGFLLHWFSSFLDSDGGSMLRNSKGSTLRVSLITVQRVHLWLTIHFRRKGLFPVLPIECIQTLWHILEAASGCLPAACPEGAHPKAGSGLPTRHPSKCAHLAHGPRLRWGAKSTFKNVLAFSEDFPAAACPDHSIPHQDGRWSDVWALPPVQAAVHPVDSQNYLQCTLGVGHIDAWKEHY